MRANSPYLPHLVFTIIILSLLLHSPFSKPKVSLKPSPSPEFSIGTDEFDSSFAKIASDENIRWLYADKDRKCLISSSPVGSGEDFLKGWWQKTSELYRFEPINPGEGPLWFIKKIISVRFDTRKLCKVGLEMELQENYNKVNHVWYVLDFTDSYVSGELFKTKPNNWDDMVDGEKLK